MAEPVIPTPIPLPVRDPRWYGYRRDTPDPRDHIFVPNLKARAALTADLRAMCPKVMDQGALGSCVPNATDGVLRYLRRTNGRRDFRHSRLQMYYDGRVIENCVDSDSGLEIRDMIKCVATIGSAHERLWPYKIEKFKRKPPPSIYKDAEKYQALEYQRVEVDAAHIRAALDMRFPVIIGISLFDSFESRDVAKTGVVPMPDLQRESDVGGHCMYVVGHGQHPGYFTIRNSWAADWGDKGDCYFPFEYIGSSKFGGDYWIITKAEQA